MAAKSKSGRPFGVSGDATRKEGGAHVFSLRSKWKQRTIRPALCLAVADLSTAADNSESKRRSTIDVSEVSDPPRTSRQNAGSIKKRERENPLQMGKVVPPQNEELACRRFFPQREPVSR